MQHETYNYKIDRIESDSLTIYIKLIRGPSNRGVKFQWKTKYHRNISVDVIVFEFEIWIGTVWIFFYNLVVLNVKNNKHIRCKMAQSSNVELVSHKKRAHRSHRLNFVTSLWPFYLFSRSLGLLPFSVKFDANGEIKKARVSVFDLLWFGLAISFYLSLAFFYFGSFNEQQISTSTSYILFLGDSLFNLNGLLYGVVIIIMDMCNRHKLVDILKRLSFFEKEASLFPFSSIC